MLNRKISKEIGEQTINNLDFKKHQYKILKFPFWAIIIFDKRRPTLVIDEAMVYDKRKKKDVPGFMHREVTHTNKKGFEKIYPNPDPNDTKPMYLKKPSKKPKTFFRDIDKKLDMPKYLKDRYSINNKK